SSWACSVRVQRKRAIRVKNCFMILCLSDGIKLPPTFPKDGFPSPKLPFFSVNHLFLGELYPIPDERFCPWKQAAEPSCISSISPRGTTADPLDTKGSGVWDTPVPRAVWSKGEIMHRRAAPKKEVPILIFF